MSSPSAIVTVGGGRYQLDHRLGGGHFGQAWLADDLDEHDQVVVKLFDPLVRPDEVVVEAALQRRVSQHPRVVSLRNVEVRSSGAPIIVMEHMPGGSVHKRIANGPADLLLAVRWTRDVLEALEHANSLGVIHRDVKPKNVLLDAQDRAQLSDFGVSEDSFHLLVTNPGLYDPLVAPELMSGASTSPGTDVYAAGVLLYHLLVGDYPFLDVNEALADKWERPHRSNLQVPMSLTRIVEKALAVDPSVRYADSGQMLQELAAERIRGSWRRASIPGMVMAWQSQTSPAPYEVTIRQRSRDLEVRARHSAGGRLRASRLEHHSTLSAAKQAARRSLLRVVAGHPL